MGYETNGFIEFIGSPERVEEAIAFATHEKIGVWKTFYHYHSNKIFGKNMTKIPKIENREACKTMAKTESNPELKKYLERIQNVFDYESKRRFKGEELAENFPDVEIRHLWWGECIDYYDFGYDIYTNGVHFQLFTKDDNRQDKYYEDRYKTLDSYYENFSSKKQVFEFVHKSFPELYASKNPGMSIKSANK